MTSSQFFVRTLHHHRRGQRLESRASLKFSGLRFAAGKVAPITAMIFTFNSSCRISIVMIYSCIHYFHILLCLIASRRLDIPGRSPYNGTESALQSQVVHLDGTM